MAVQQHKMLGTLMFLVITIGFGILFFVDVIGLLIIISWFREPLSELSWPSLFFLPLVLTLIVFTAILRIDKKDKLRKQLFTSVAWAPVIALVVFVMVFLLTYDPWQVNNFEACIEASEYYCGNMVYSYTTGNIIADLGQNTGTTWTASLYAFAPQGTATTASGVPIVLFVSVSSSNALISGQILNQVSLPASAADIAVGTSLSGTIWVCYSTTSGATLGPGVEGSCTASSGTVYYDQMATLTAKAA